MKIKNVFIRTLCCLSIALLTTVPASASSWPVNETDIGALAGIVIDADSGAVLFEKDADTLYPPASTTKLLTALVVLENCNDLSDTITFSKTAIEQVEAGSGNGISVDEGDQLSVEDCLYALLLRSSNQSANALAEYVAGDIESFVDMMNDKVQALGASSSHFENPSGLNGDTQNVTARELAMIARAAYEHPKLVEINSAITYRLPAMARNPEGLTIENEHRLIKTTDETSPYYYPPAKAGKTGYLLLAGNTLVTYAEQDGRRLISVVLKGQAGQPRQYFIDGKAMLEFGFEHFENYSIAEHDPLDFSDLEYEADDLFIDNTAVITLPKGVSFDTANRIVTPLSSNHAPADAVALVEYRYHNKFVGSAYVHSTSKQSAVNILSEDASNEASDSANTTRPSSEHKKLNVSVIIKTVLIGLITLVIIALGILIYFYRKKEAQIMAERRSNRQRRLEEMGISQTDFEQMVQSRKQNKTQ